MATLQKKNNLYGFESPLSNLPALPIISLRNPTVRDFAALGTIWVNRLTNEVYVITSIVGNQAAWQQFTAPGGAGLFTSLSVNPGPTILNGTLTSTGSTALATTGASINSFGNTTGATSLALLSGTGGTSATSTGSISLASSLAGVLAIEIDATNATGGISFTAGTGGFQVANANGPFNVSTGTGAVNISNDATVTSVNVGSGGGLKTVVVGSLTAGSTLTLRTPVGTPIVASNGLTATTGNITATNGSVVLSTAATFVALPGPVFVRSGAGAPAGALALHTGDMYIRTDAGNAAERIYVATAVGAWTNVTCAA